MLSTLLAFTLILHTDTLKLSSPQIDLYGQIAVDCTCDGKEYNPEINIEGIPKSAKSLVLIIENPDVAVNHFAHWVVYNIPPQNVIKANSIPGVQAVNSMGKLNYMGPCPSAGSHRYVIKVFALSDTISSDKEMTRVMVEREIRDQVIMSGELYATYTKMIMSSTADVEDPTERP